MRDLYHWTTERFLRRISGNQRMITLPTHCSDKHHSTSENPNEYQKPPQSILDILPIDVLQKILEKAPQLGTTCRELHEFLPKIDRINNPGIHFPSSNTKPENIIEIHHNGLTFSYQKPKDGSSRIWNGCKPSLHTPAIMLPLCEYSCDFCNEKDRGMTTQGSNIYGVLFVCPECQHGLTARLKEIFGETLWELIEANQQIVVPRTNGPNELWYVSSKLPVIHQGTWHLRVQSHRSLFNEDFIGKTVPVEELKELNEDVPP